MENNGTGRKILLKPAKFQSTKSEDTNGKSSENGNAPTFLSNNPFLRCDKEDVEPTKPEEKSNETEKNDSTTTSKDLFKPAKSNLFVQSSALSESNFVFGQNLHERVVIDKVNSSEKSDEKSEEDKPSSGLFSAALTKSKSPEKECSNDSTQESTNEDKTESLVEAAKKYEEMKSAQKRKFEEIQLTTGEEDERNILEVNCKLYAFIENNYEERGRGTLRLNDSKDSSYSRVVFRASGSFRVLLNTKVFRDQVCETPSQKSLRLTAVDAQGGVKIFLVMGRVEDISQLNHVLSDRIRKAKERPEVTSPVEDETSSQTDSQQSDVVEPESKRTAIASE